jgi:GNAT superfamily N-acetyltransferase
MIKNLTIRDCVPEDFDLVFDYVEALWTYNTYDKETIRKVYGEVLANENDFAFLLFDEDRPVGWCHGTIFNTFWLSGKTCYVSSIISDPNARRRGYGRALMDRAVEIARAHQCHAVVLDSGMPRTEAHTFYEIYGFEKCAYCFEFKL